MYKINLNQTNELQVIEGSSSRPANFMHSLMLLGTRRPISYTSLFSFALQPLDDPISYIPLDRIGAELPGASYIPFEFLFPKHAAILLRKKKAASKMTAAIDPITIPAIAPAEIEESSEFDALSEATVGAVVNVVLVLLVAVVDIGRGSIC